MFQKKLNRRDFLRIATVAAAGATMAACAPAATQAPSAPAAPAATNAPAAAATAVPAAAATATPVPPAAPTAVAPPTLDPTAVTWWYAWGNLDAGMQAFVQTPTFKDTMKDTKFDFKGAVPSEAILTAVAAGTPPDGGSNFDYPNLFSKGAVIPVNDYVATSTKIKKDDVLEKLWESSFYGDKMIGVPGIEGYLWWGLNCNIDTATKDGLDPAALPTTWEETLEWHKKETKFDAAGNLQTFGLDPYDAMAGEQDFAVQSFGGFNWWDEQNRKINLDNDAMTQALDMCGQFIKIVGPDKFDGMRQTQGMGGWGGSYNAGMQNMIMEGYWHPGETEIQKPEIAKFNRATWAPVPASRKGKKIMATGAHFIQIFKDAAHKDGMFKFSELLWTDEFSDILFKEVGWIFGRKSYLAKVNASAYPGLDFYMQAAANVDEWIIGRRCPIHWFVATQYTEIRNKVARDLMTPKEGAAELQKRAENEWAAQGLS
jgi:hypothetical protein